MKKFFFALVTSLGLVCLFPFVACLGINLIYNTPLFLLWTVGTVVYLFGMVRVVAWAKSLEENL